MTAPPEPDTPVAATTLGMSAIAVGVAVASTATPRLFLRTFGLDPATEATGAALLGWRLFAVRTATLGVLAARGNPTARDAFLPVQLMDQATWWWGYRRGELPLRTAAMAAAASGAIIALDLRRRLAPGPVSRS